MIILKIDFKNWRRGGEGGGDFFVICGGGDSHVATEKRGGAACLRRRGFLRNLRRRGFSRRYAPYNPDSLQGRPCKASTVFFVLSYPKTSFFLIQSQKSRRSVCGEAGIRTPETLLKFTRFPGVPLKPLEHLSFRRKKLR